jgi:hypothetical protein
MEIKKVNLDREPISSAHIQQKQDFTSLIKSQKQLSNLIWKKTFFFGGVGIASLATASMFLLSDFESSTVPSDNKFMAKTSEKPVLAEEDKIDLKEVGPIAAIDSKPCPVPKKNNVQEGSQDTKENSVLDQTILKKPKSFSNEIKVNSVKLNLPALSGKYFGTISSLELCSENGITTETGVLVKEFKIQYASANKDELKKVSGNSVPSSVCEDIQKAGFSQMVFITDIRGVLENKEITLPSMNFWVEIKG